MKIVDIAFTCYCSTNVKRSREFYEGVLGLVKAREFNSPDGAFQWIEYDIGANTLALALGDGKDWAPSPQGTAVAFEVDDIQAFAKKIKESGAKVVLDVTESPACHMLVFTDPDGNRMLVHKKKK